MSLHIPSWLIRNECCCNCQHLLKVMSHPWVNGLPSTQQVGWVCAVATVMDKGIAGQFAYVNRGHGICELHQKIVDNPPFCERTKSELDDRIREARGE
jgi:hypothetical protein